MATISSSHNQYNLSWWSQWWPYLLVLVILLLFPFIAGLTIGDPEAVSETNLNNYMMLGIVSAHTPISPLQSATFDARQRGGGIIEELKDQALKLMPSA